MSVIRRYVVSSLVGGLFFLSTVGHVMAGTATAYTWHILQQNPRFYWDFNEETGTGGIVELVRRQANDVLVPSGNATTVVGASANLGNAASFDGTADTAFRASSMQDGTMPGAWALEMWFRADTISSSYMVTGGFNNPGVIHAYTDEHIELFSGAGRTGSNGPVVGDNNWHHLVATFYGNGAGFGVADRVDFALDGVVLADVGRGGFSSAFGLQDALTVGADAVRNNRFEGLIDQLALYDLSGLTEAQVAERTTQLATHFNLINMPPETSLQLLDRTQMSYTYETAPGDGLGNYDDPDQDKLTDGVIGSTETSPADIDWVGFKDVNPKLTLDLGSVQSVDSIWIDYLAGGRNDIHAPTGLNVRVSLDGVEYGDPLTFTGFNDAGGTAYNWNRRLIADMEGVTAKYLELEFERGGEWTLLGEAQVVIPEPSTGVMLLVGLGSFLLLRRRITITNR